MRLGPVILLISIVLLAPCLSDRAAAQTTASGGLTGVVTDPSGAIVPDARVELTDDFKGTTQTTATDRGGVYRFFFVAPGKYALIVTHGGFQNESRVANVPLGPPVTVNVTLELATETATVKVTEEVPLIQAENGDVSTSVNQKQISAIPNPGNDLTYIAQTAPGMVMNVENQFGANFSSLGMPGTSNLFTIDGQIQNDNGANIPLVGAAFLLLGQNEIQEATVVSIGYSGQFGGAAGANVNYITKSGSNELHGNAQYYWNGSAFNANDWFNKEGGNPRPFDIANQWAGSLGGPIKTDRLFFFFDTEGLRLLIPQILPVSIPSAQFESATLANIDSRFGSASASDAFYRKIFNLYNNAPGASSATPGSFENATDGCNGFSDPQTGLGTRVPCAALFTSQRERITNDTLVSGRIDWNPRNQDRVFLRVQNDFGHNSFYDDSINPVFDAVHGQSWWQGELIETHAFDTSAANQFTLASMYFTDISELKNGSAALAALPTSLNFSVASSFTSIGAFNSLASPAGRPTTQYQVADDLVKAWRKHKLGIGAGVERIYWTNIAYTLNAVGTLIPQTLDAFYQGGVDPASPRTNFTQLTQSFASADTERINFYNLGLYGQDEWHVRSNLILTLALRIEHYSNPVCPSACFARMDGPFDSVSHDPNQPYDRAILVDRKQAFQSMDDILWSPRFSFAWQPLGVLHNTVLRGGVGIFHDPVPGNLATTLSSNPPLLNSYSIVGDNLSPNEETSLFKDALASNTAFVSGFAGGQTLAQIQTTISSFYPTGFSPPAINIPGRQTHAPQYQRWSLELQQAFGAHTSLSIGYFGHHGIHELMQNPNANAFGFGSLPPALCTSPAVPPCADPRFSEVTEIDTNAVSNYNGMIISFEHQFTRWTQGMFQANYTYSHAFDEVSNGGLFGFTFGSSLNAQVPNTLRDAYGPADYDVRHSLNASYVWEIPLKAALRGHGPGILVSGWQISGTIFARTGFPYTVFDFLESGNLERNNYFGAIYAVPAGPLGPGTTCGEGAAYPLAPHPCQPRQVSAHGIPNANARFVQAGCEIGFNAGNLGPSGVCDGPLVEFAQGRNKFRGPSYFNTDISIMKNSKLPGWENGVLGIGFQFFNVFNHPNFSLPDNGISDETFGQILSLEQPPTGILGAGLGGDVAPRMIQLKLLLQF
jgi:carboxypeptidase family protein/TonB-dependent receptor-like protein